MKLTENMLPDLEMFLNLYYLKIIRFNIHTGEYSIILDNCSFWNGDYYHILELLRDCPVHPDDVDDYNKNIIDITYNMRIIQHMHSIISKIYFNNTKKKV